MRADWTVAVGFMVFRGTLQFLTLAVGFRRRGIQLACEHSRNIEGTAVTARMIARSSSESVGFATLDAN
jgi:hypothetical protein